MSSTEEDDTFTPHSYNVALGNVKDELMENINSVDSESFSKKCNISSDEKNDDINASIACTNSNIVTLQHKKNRSVSKRTSIYDKYTHPCVPKINCPEKIITEVNKSLFSKKKSNCCRLLPKHWLGNQGILYCGNCCHDYKTEELEEASFKHLKVNHQTKFDYRKIFCIDMSSEMEEIPFRKNDGSQHSALSMVKRTIELFVHNKNYIDKKHEYSLMVLYESATWVREFTNDPMELIDSLEDLSETQPCNSCDLASIVQLISEKFELVVPVNLLPIPYVIRVVLIYGRSNCMFHFSDEELQDTLMRYPFLFLDILYIHEPPAEHNRCKEIYDALCDLDEQNKSYIFEVTHNVTKLHNCMAKFLAHPLQRVAQKDTNYKIHDVVPQEI